MAGGLRYNMIDFEAVHPTATVTEALLTSFVVQNSLELSQPLPSPPPTYTHHPDNNSSGPDISVFEETFYSDDCAHHSDASIRQDDVSAYVESFHSCDYSLSSDKSSPAATAAER